MDNNKLWVVEHLHPKYGLCGYWICKTEKEANAYKKYLEAVNKDKLGVGEFTVHMREVVSWFLDI